MQKINHKIPYIASSVIIFLITVLSGWLSYQNIGNRPSSREDLPENNSCSSEMTTEDISTPAISTSDISTASTNPDDFVTSDVNDNGTSSDLSSPTEEKITIKYVVINKATNVRAEDSDTADKVATLIKGAEVEYISESKKRYKVKYAGSKTGWIIKTCGEIKEKEKIIKHIALYTSGDPIRMAGTKEADDIAAILKNYATTGASMAIIQNGTVAYSYEYGYANKQKLTTANSILTVV